MVERTPREQPIERPTPPPVERPARPPREQPIERPTPPPVERPAQPPREQPIERPTCPPVERPAQPPRREPISPIEERPEPTPRPIEKPPIFAPRPVENAQLIEIMQYQFAVYDLALYLDTHPNDMRAHEARKRYAARLHELIMAYEEIHGPMNVLSHRGDYRKYINEPWPWEICF